jgi:hypothetical protein
VWLFSLEYHPIAPPPLRRRGYLDLAIATVHDVETRTDYKHVLITQREPKLLIRDRLASDNDLEIFAWVKWQQNGEHPRYLTLVDAGDLARQWLKDAVMIQPEDENQR